MAAEPSSAETGKDPQDDASSDKDEKAKADTKPSEPDSASLSHYLAGRFAESQGDTSNGLRFAEEELKKDPDNKKTLASVYRMYVLSGKIDEAASIAAKLLGTKVVDDGSEFSPEMCLALTSVRHQDYDKAGQYLKSIPKAGFNNFLVPVMKAWIKLGKGEIKSPLDIKDVVSDPRLILPHVYMSLALINDIAGFSDQARSYYEQAVKDERTEPLRAVEAFSNFYLRHGEKDKSKKLIDDYQNSHGEAFLANEILESPATDQDAKPMVKDPSEGIAELFYTLANIFHGVRAPADEVATLHLALYMRPDFPAAQFLLANAHELEENYPAAIEAYKAIDPQSPYFIRGRIRGLFDESEIGDSHVEESLTKLSALAAEMPHDIDALLVKGDILRMHDRYKEAVETYSSAINRLSTLEKHHWVVFFSRGACYERLGRWDDAEADMKKALKLSPGEPDVLNYLGYSWLSKQEHIAEAKKMIEDAYEARPEDAHIIDSMGYAFYVTGDYASAQEYYQQALERTPDDPTVNDHLGDTYWQLGHKTEARYQWNRAVSEDKDEVEKRQIQEKIKKGIPLKAASKSSGDKKETIELPADE